MLQKLSIIRLKLVLVNFNDLVVHVLPAVSLTVLEINAHGLLHDLVVLEFLVLFLHRGNVAAGAELGLDEVRALGIFRAFALPGVEVSPPSLVFEARAVGKYLIVAIFGGLIGTIVKWFEG